MIKFNSESLIVGCIKELLKDFNLPKCKVLVDNTFYYADKTYIKDNNLYKALADGQYHEGDSLLDNFTRLNHYVFDEDFLNITKNLEVKSNIYDSYTHKYLGNYLRFLRDYLGLDLMSMYNCYANELASRLNIEISSTNVFSTDDIEHKIYVVPVKFNKKYSIGIDCNSIIEIVAGIYNNNSLVELEGISNSLYSTTYLKKSRISFKSPFVYDKLIVTPDSQLNNQILNSQEENLVLFIKVPANNNSSLVVVESDVTDGCSPYYDENNISKVQEVVYNFNEGKTGSCTVISRPQLFAFNDEKMHPFSDRLVEYLLEGVIDFTDDIPENIKRVQLRLIHRHEEDLVGLKSFYGVAGIYNDYTKAAVNAVCRASGIETKKGYNKFDMLGYVDKDAEMLLGEDE